MNRRIPSWTGMLFSVIGLLGLTLPFLEVDGRGYSLFQIYCDLGHQVVAWANLIFEAALLLSALLGWRYVLFFGGEMLLWQFGSAAAGAASTMGVSLLFRYMAEGAWLCFANALFLLLNFHFRPLDRAILSGLLTWWREDKGSGTDIGKKNVRMSV